VLASAHTELHARAAAITDANAAPQLSERHPRALRDRRGVGRGSSIAARCNASNDLEIELTLNKGREEPYTHSTGYDHISLVVPNDWRTRGALVTKATSLPK